MATKTSVFGGVSGGLGYEGEVNAEGLPHGAGILVSKDGWRYEGGFRNDVLHGYGVLTKPDGERHEGEFRDGAEHGHGVRTFPEGTRIEGKFWNGYKHGLFTVTGPDGTSRAVEYRDDALVNAGAGEAGDTRP